jgi:hypothetical protein
VVRDGWTTTHAPYPISIGGVDMAIDLGAEQQSLYAAIFWLCGQLTPSHLFCVFGESIRHVSIEGESTPFL